MTRLRRRPWPGILLSALLVQAVLCQAAEPTQEELVKAAVVFKLTKFVDWPSRSFYSDDAPLRVCALGDTGVVDALETVHGRISQGRALQFLRVGSATPDEVCHLLFVADKGLDMEAQDTATAGTRPVLTVSDIRGFADSGGIVELTRRGKRLGFRINVGNARRAELVVSAPLLELAEIVE